MPERTDVTFYVVAFHWGWDVYDGAGVKLDGPMRVPEGTAIELYAVNSQAEEAIGRLPAAVANAIRATDYPATPFNASQGDLPVHGFLIAGYRVVEQLPPDAAEPVRVAFVADRPGTYQIECSIYCGVGHQAHMSDKLVVEAADAPAPGETSTAEPGLTLAGDSTAGREFFTSQACNACHPGGAQGAGPSLFGLTDRLTDSQIRSQIRDGGTVMPAFGTDVLSDEDLANVIAFLKTLE